ncbi:hypothetical protein [Gallaecimonas xiamenensis]|nr:hypothetical protein [Gallaecimonas xiamenensis]
MIKKWARPEGMMSDIADYLKKGPNEEKIDELYKAIELRGLNPERECFEDYLACKYIRNAYIHGEWNESQRIYVESRNFPSTTMQFSPEHYARIKKCYYHILNKLGMANALEK